MVYIFKNKKPEINDIVVTIVEEINSLNVITKLPDYNDLTGYISYSELSKKKNFKIGKIVTVGKEIVTIVTGINEKNNYVELSVRILTETNIKNFNIEHKRYITLYNLWRYVYLKLFPELEMNLNNINENELNIFMENTLWKLYNNIENLNTETILEKLLNKEENIQLISLLQNENNKEIKLIIDNYITLKTIIIKPFKEQDVKLTSYELNGSDDIKKSLNYKSYEFYNDIDIDYDIDITYLTDSIYRLNIKQKDIILQNSNNNIDIIYNKIINEIIKRCNNLKINIKV